MAYLTQQTAAANARLRIIEEGGTSMVAQDRQNTILTEETTRANNEAKKFLQKMKAEQNHS